MADQSNTANTAFRGDRVIRATEAARMLGVGRTSFYELVKGKDFPRPIALGERARGFLESELVGWLKSRRA